MEPPKINTAYGSAPDSKADTGLVEPPKAVATNAAGQNAGYQQGMNHAFGNVGAGIQAEQERKAQASEAANQGMLHAHGNVGAGIQAEQERKGQAAEAANQGMLHAHGNVGAGIQAEQQRRTEAANKGRDHLYTNMGEGVTRAQERKERWQNHGYALGMSTAEYDRGEETGDISWQERDHAYAQGMSTAKYDDASGNAVANKQKLTHGYAMGTGGVSGNYKPEYLREAERAVDILDTALLQIERITGQDASTSIAEIEGLQGNPMLLDESNIWGQAAAILDRAQNATGFTYEEALSNEAKQTERFEREQADKQNDQDGWEIDLWQVVQLVPNGKEILTDVIDSTKIDPNTNPGSEELRDLSPELNSVIMQCCNEFAQKEPNQKPMGWQQKLFLESMRNIYNAKTWINGVFGEWDFVAEIWWQDNKDIEHDSLVPDEIQGLAGDARKDYFVVNGIRMNREQFGNYVKGATAQNAFPDLSAGEIVSILGLGQSVVDNIEDDIQKDNKYNFSWENEIEDTYFTLLGAQDMKNGVIEGRD